ncbi:MAG: glycosyltransferase family 4 protein [Betaproteobacteria bacterium]
MANTPLRVAMVTTFYPPFSFGGDAQYVRRLTHALARRGCEVEVIHDADAWRVLSGAQADAPMPSPESEPQGVTVHRLQSRWALGSTLLTQQLGRPVVQAKSLRALLARGFDVIHYHNVSLVGGPGILSMGDALKFYTPHEHWLVCPTHVLWRHNREICTGRECVRCSIAYRRPPQVWRATGYLERQCAHVDVFIALSRSVADNHRAFGFSRDMTLMASFLPAAERLPAAASSGATPQRPYFLFVGRLEAMKGLQDAIPHFVGDGPADLLVAGSGAFEPELRRLAADAPRVKFLGHVAADALRALYLGAVALIAPSLCFEVFGMVLLEAFGQGTPVIARNRGSYAQIVEESGGGLLFDDGESLRSAILRLAGDADLRARLGAKARSAVETRWSEETAVAEYLALVRATALARSRGDVAAKVDGLTSVAAAAAM